MFCTSETHFGQHKNLINLTHRYIIMSVKTYLLHLFEIFF